MVSFKVCKKCPYGEYQREEYEEDGNLRIRPSVHCKKTEDILMMNSDIPDECPYILEHKLTCQDIPESFANYLSGSKPFEEKVET